MTRPNPTRSSVEILFIVSGAVALAQAASSFTVPAMPKLVDALGGNAVIVGLSVSLYSIARLVTNIPAGLLSEKLGRRSVLVGGGLLTAAATSLGGIAPNIETLLVLRLLTGVGAAATITAGFVAITDLSSAANRSRSLGVLQGWQFLVGLAGPALGGFLAEYGGARLPFYVSGIGIGLISTYALLRMPDSRGAERSQTSTAAPTSASSESKPLTLLRNRNYLLICAVVFTLFFTRFGATQTLVPLFAYDKLDWRPAQVGLLFSAATLINGLLIFPSAYLSDKRGRKIAIVPSGVLAVVGLATMAFATGSTAFVAAYLLMVAASSFGGQAPMAYLGDVVPSSVRGAATGLYRTFGDAAGVLGPLVTTWLAHSYSYSTGFLAAALVAAVSYLLFGVFAPETAGRTIERKVEP